MVEFMIDRDSLYLKIAGLLPLFVAASTGIKALALASAFFFTSIGIFASFFVQTGRTANRHAFLLPLLFGLITHILCINIIKLINPLLFGELRIVLLLLPFLPGILIETIPPADYRERSKYWKKPIITMAIALGLLVFGILRAFLFSGTGEAIQEIARRPFMPFIAHPAGGLILLAIIFAVSRYISAIIRRKSRE